MQCCGVGNSDEAVQRKLWTAVSKGDTKTVEETAARIYEAVFQKPFQIDKSGDYVDTAIPGYKKKPGPQSIVTGSVGPVLLRSLHQKVVLPR